MASTNSSPQVNGFPDHGIASAIIQASSEVHEALGAGLKEELYQKSLKPFLTKLRSELMSSKCPEGLAVNFGRPNLEVRKISNPFPGKIFQTFSFFSEN